MPERCYNLTVKLLKRTTNALAATLAAAAILALGAPCTAYAAEGEMYYPEDFTNTVEVSAEISDYAIEGDSVALAYGNTLCVLAKDETGDRKLADNLYNDEIARLDYADGELYVRELSGGVYRYPDFTTIVEHDFPEERLAQAVVGDCTYMLNPDEGSLYCWNAATNNMTTMGDGGFSNMKIYDGKAYIILNNALCILEGTSALPVSLEYTDYPEDGDIPAGNVATLLKNADYEVKTAEIAAGAYCTQVDPDVTGEYFDLIRTFRTEAITSCLVLAEEGNAAMVATAEGYFVTAIKDLEQSTYTPPANDWPTNDDGTCLANVRESTGIYSSPCMTEATLLGRVERGAVVTVTEKCALGFMDKVFYHVTYKSDDGQSLSGFMAVNFMDEHDYSADMMPENTTGDEEFGYENDIVTVVLALVIVGLVILAIAYLMIVGTRPTKNGGKTRPDKSGDNNPQ